MTLHELLPIISGNDNIHLKVRDKDHAYLGELEVPARSFLDTERLKPYQNETVLSLYPSWTGHAIGIELVVTDKIDLSDLETHR